MTMQLEQVWRILTNLWEQIPQEYMIVFTFGGAVFALLNCFMGYRLRKVWGCLLGLAVGGAGGAAARCGGIINQKKAEMLSPP